MRRRPAGPVLLIVPLTTGCLTLDQLPAVPLQDAGPPCPDGGRPAPETCNGRDDDCDGLVDEDHPQRCQECESPQDEVCNGVVDDGVCAAAPG